jgi:hypothetical protein
MKQEWKAVLKFGVGHLLCEYISKYNMEHCSRNDVNVNEAKKELHETRSPALVLHLYSPFSQVVSMAAKEINALIWNEQVRHSYRLQSATF